MSILKSYVNMSRLVLNHNMMKYSKIWANGRRFITWRKAIPWIASSKSSDQKLILTWSRGYFKEKIVPIKSTSQDKENCIAKRVSQSVFGRFVNGRKVYCLPVYGSGFFSPTLAVLHRIKWCHSTHWLLRFLKTSFIKCYFWKKCSRVLKEL